MSDTVTAVKLGDTVEYRDSNGRRKAALVIGTAESVEPGTGIDVPEAGTAHLLVFGLSGRPYTSFSIPEGEGPHTFAVR